MPILVYRNMTFEWHDAKFRLVYKERELTFEEVCSVFFDYHATTFEDDTDYDDNEQRFITVGMSENYQLLAVVWVERDDSIRVITAFEPSQWQRKSYANTR